ncbi:hypothetical protein [Lysobacter sp. GCM10012299]|uniref:hypothetical protein n=1 Tax=Lysobacter sp. GCM10012299 TaxID=3317333 RepID=UPI00361F6F21
MKEYEFHLSTPVKFARAGGEAGETTLIVFKEPMYRHAGATAALKGHYTQAMFQASERASRQGIEVKNEQETEPTAEDRAAFINLMIRMDGTLSEAIIGAFIRLVKMPGIAAVDGDIQLSEVHLASIPYEDIERMTVSFLANFIERSSSTVPTA